MTLAQLYYIVAVDNHRHFSTAASHCFVTQPTLSMQIQKLEEELGVLIFDRTKQPVVPTDIGKKIISQARIILQEAERLENIVNSETGEFSGTLKIGVIPTIAPYLIPLFLQSFVENYPNIELIIDEITTKEIIKKINKDMLDVGILALPINSDDLIEKTLYYEPFVAFISEQNNLFKQEKINISDISPDELLLLKEGHCLREHTLKLCRFTERDMSKSSRKLLFESGNLDTLKKLVQQNFGVTLLPHLAISDLSKEEEKLIREFHQPVPKREIGLIYSKSTSKTHLLEVLEKEIIQSVPAELHDKENAIVVE